MFVIKNTKLFIVVAGMVALSALGSIFAFGLTPGVDFAGGTIIELNYPVEYPAQEQIEGAVSSVVEGGYSVRPTGEHGYTIRTPFLEETEREALLEATSFSLENPPIQERVSSIGPVIGEELTGKAFGAIAFVIVVIILFIAFSFRQRTTGEGEEKVPLVAGPSSWYYGLAAILALIFDTLIPVGAFAILGAFTPAEVDVLFVTALLAILGYSVNDTIVVFDRIRENLYKNVDKKRKEDFSETVGRSLNETYMRSINTSLTTFAVLLTLYLLGGSTTQFFAFMLLVGVVAGTYSSIFLASPLLVMFEARRGKK